MKRMFTSATIKLTASYLLILVMISLVFSFIIFELATSEISSRLERLQIRVEGTDRTLTLPGPLTLSEIRVTQANEARASIFVGLMYTNIAVILAGGVGSYVLARRTLRPIQEAHERQSRFASDASHELRTPLTIMKSEIQVALRDKTIKRSELVELLNSNLEEVDKLTELSSSLLQLSKLDEGDIQRADKVDMRELINGCLSRLKNANRTFDMDLPDTAVLIEGNAPLLADMLAIILDNAVKYSTPGSTVRIEVSSNGRSCECTVTNDGVGIPSSQLDRVFDRFYQVNRAREYPRTGYGLGLALARRIVVLHDGQIRLSSTPGVSTVCTVQLPTLRKNR